MLAAPTLIMAFEPIVPPPLPLPASSFEISNNPVPCALILPPTPMLMIASPLIEPPLIPLRLALSIRKLASPLVVARSPLRSKNRMAIPPIVPPLLLSIAALRVPVETLFAVTLIMAWEPIVPPVSFEIVRSRRPAW